VTARLLDQLARRGIRLRRVGDDQLGVTAPEGRLPPEAVTFIRQHKASLLAALADQPATGAADLPAWLDPRYRRAAMEAGSITWRDQIMLWPADVSEAWGESAAILEHDGGLSREEAEARAYLDHR